MFSQKKLFLYFGKRNFPAARLENYTREISELEKLEKLALKKKIIFRETEISSPKLKKKLYFQEGTCEAWKTNKDFSCFFAKILSAFLDEC